MKEMLTLKCDMDKYSLLENKTQQMLKTNRTNLYMQELPLTTPTKIYMCVLQHRCAERYI